MDRIVPASTLDLAGRTAAAALIALAFAPYYRSLGLDLYALHSVLAEEFEHGGTEIELTQVLMENNQPLAIMSAYPAIEMAARQRAGLFHLISSFVHDTDKLLNGSAAHAASVGPVPDNSFYLARLAVDPAYQGRGEASKVLRLLYDKAGDRQISLHVHSDNTRAIAFYAKEGFVFNDPPGSAYRCMLRN